MSRFDEKEKRTLTAFILLFIVLTAGISLGGYLSFNNFEQQFRAQAESQLLAVAQLKVNDLANWRKERLADAEMLHRNPVFAALVQDYFNDSNDALAREHILDWLDNYRLYEEYDRVRLLDLEGAPRLFIPEGSPPLSPVVAKRIPGVIESGQVTLVDFYRRSDDAQIRLALLIPIMDSQTGEKVVGVVSISIDPEVYLYPYINEWPSHSDTAETLLVRREGNDVLFLNELRFDSNTALILHTPLTEIEQSAVRAVLGESGVVEALDYRGEQVIGALESIPDSPWFLVARMDTAEVYAPLQARLWQTLGLVGMAILVAGAGLVTIWRQQRILYYRRQVDAARAVSESEKQLKEAQTIARMGSYLLDIPSGRWQGSDVLDKILGIDSKFERSFESWMDLIHPDDRQYMMDYLTREVIGAQARFDREYRIIRHNDQVERWVHGLGELEFDAHGSVTAMLGTIQDITESKRTEEVIRRSEEKYRRVVETANEGILFLDSETRITFTNQQLAFMLGYTTDEMIGQKLESFLAEGQLSERSSQVVDHTQRMDDVYEQCFKRKDGGRHWALVSARAVFDSDGNLEGFFGMVTDINERKHAEEKMRQLSQAVEQSPVAILITDTSGVIQYANPRFTQVTGYTLEETLGQNPRIVKSGETSPEDYKNLWKTILSGGEWRGELHNRKKNGELYWESVSISPIKDNAGRITHFLAVKEDITARKETEDALRGSEEHYRSLVEAIPDLVFCLDAQGRYIEFKAENVDDLYMPPDAFLGKPYTAILPPDISRQFASAIAAAQFSRKTQTLEYLLTFPGENTKYFEAHLAVTDDGRIVVVVRNVTERKHAEQKLANYTEHLEEEVSDRTRELRDTQEQLVRQERLALLGQVAGSIGHELRNPLGVISNAIYFLKMAQPDVNEKVKEYLAIIENEARASDKIITDLLDFTRLKSVDRESASVSDLIRETFERFPVSPSVDVVLEIPADLPKLYVDPHNVVQILGNLTINACQAMLSAGAQRTNRLTISASAQGDMLRLDVQDTGIGIPAENMTKLFEPLFTTKTKGIGLGLAVSRKLVEANGGRIEVRSEAGLGSTFTLWLPVSGT